MKLKPYILIMEVNKSQQFNNFCAHGIACQSTLPSMLKQKFGVSEL